jgi:hypothetical protein
VDVQLVEPCAFCSFVATGPLEEARQAFTEHVCDRAEGAVSKRSRSGLSLR